jgi:septal ring factor EnvC (AmiA/AmiB activator)
VLPSHPPPTAATGRDETAALTRRIADVETEIEEVKASRKACVLGNDLWLRADDELKQLRTKEEQLRDELRRKDVLLGHSSTLTGLCQAKVQFHEHMMCDHEASSRASLVHVSSSSVCDSGV